jgi:hypothetical protein
MVDINQKIADILSPLAPVELADSEADLRLPSIYITPLSNASAVTFDNRDFLTNISYQIDIYAETPKKCAAMAQAVDDVMQENGWTRSNGQPMGRQRYVLTYTALVSEKFNIYKE